MRRKKRKNRFSAAIAVMIAAVAVLFVLIGVTAHRNREKELEAEILARAAAAESSQDTLHGDDPDFWKGSPEIDVQLLTPNNYSRSQKALEQINGIVVHYTANPGSSAQANRDYFENLKDGEGTKASSHFVIGLGGEIIQCIPSSEISYASNDRNYDTLSIECCHPDESGQFTDKTYQSLVDLTAWLCRAFEVDPDSVIRHYDVTGKDCPKYYVENEDAWQQLKADIAGKYRELEEAYGKRQ